jgi:hypothetical protein
LFFVLRHQSSVCRLSLVLGTDSLYVVSQHFNFCEPHSFSHEWQKHVHRRKK